MRKRLYTIVEQGRDNDWVNMKMKKTFLYILFAGIAFAACDNEKMSDSEREPRYDQNGALINHVCIPVRIADPESGVRFGDGREAYLYHATCVAMACTPLGENIPLKQTDISADSLSCTLTGDVTFYRYYLLDDEIKLNPVTKGVGIQPSIMILYGWKQDDNGIDGLYADYTNQDGSVQSAIEHRYLGIYTTLPDLSVSHVIESRDTLKLAPVDTRLEIDMSFVQEDGTTPAQVTRLKKATLSSEREGILNRYRVFSRNKGSITTIPVSCQKLYLSMPYYVDTRYDQKDDVMTLRAIDWTTLDTYQGTWTVEADKYRSGNFKQSLVMQKQKLLVISFSETPVRTCTPQNGKYNLSYGGDYAVYNSGAADIICSGRSNVHLFDARLDGQLQLSSEHGGGIIHSSMIFSTSSYIMNRDKVAIKNTGVLPIIISQGSYLKVIGDIEGNIALQKNAELTINGNINGMVTMNAGSRLNIYGDVSNTTFYSPDGVIRLYYDYSLGYTNYVCE